MAKRISGAKALELAQEKIKRETARKAHKQENPAPYKPRPNADYETFYAKDLIDIGRNLHLRVNTKVLTVFGGAAKAGLLTIEPATGGTVVIDTGTKIPTFRVQWFKGNATPTVIAETAMHGRWLRFADKNPTTGLYYHELPFYAMKNTPPATNYTIEALVDAFESLFDTPAEKTALLGETGRIYLKQGYGSQWISLAKIAA